MLWLTGINCARILTLCPHVLVVLHSKMHVDRVSYARSKYLFLLELWKNLVIPVNSCLSYGEKPSQTIALVPPQLHLCWFASPRVRSPQELLRQILAYVLDQKWFPQRAWRFVANAILFLIYINMFTYVYKYVAGPRMSVRAYI